MGHQRDRFVGIGSLADGRRPDEVALLAMPHHLRAARLALTLFARHVKERLRFLRIGYIDDGRAVVFDLAGERVERAAAVMTDVGDPAAVQGEPALGLTVEPTQLILHALKRGLHFVEGNIAVVDLLFNATANG